MFRTLVLALSLVAAFPLASPAADTGFLTKTFKDADGSEHKYVVFLPDGYTGDKEYPVILFLHGSGETKGGAKQPADVGIGPAIKSREKEFPFIVVIPQSVDRTWRAGSKDANRALAMLDATMKEYKVDPKRQYLTGLSMGGFGTWSIAAANPDRWAAIVPICGGGDPKSAEKIKDIPTWVFHGDADKSVPVNLSRSMVKALEAAGGKPKYTEYPGVGHNSWDKAYANDELYTWLLSNKK